MNEKRRTIVGGRSRSNRLVGDFPRGIEILLKKASVDSAFGQYLLQTPLEAARSIALDLKPVEINILTNTPRPLLQKMIISTRVPKHHVKTFRTATVTAMLALVLSTTVVLPVLAGGGQEELPAQTIEQEELTRNRMAVVQEALEAYRVEYGTYPDTKTWYQIQSPLAEYAPLSDFYDPWKRIFHYNAVKEDGEIVNYKLESLGLDIETFSDNIPCPIVTDKHLFSGVSPINILYPLEEQTITVAELSDGILEIRADHENEIVQIHWYLNGISIGSTVKVHNLAVEPNLGKNTLLLVDENEESADIVFSAVEEEISHLLETILLS